MKTAAIIPVKTFSKAKSRLGLSSEKTEKICEIMLEEIIHTLTISPLIDQTVVVTKEPAALEICKKFKAIPIHDSEESEGTEDW